MTEEIERPISRWRRDRADTGERIEHFVRRQRPGGIQQDRQDVAADMGQALTVQLGLVGGGLDQLFLAGAGRACAAPATAVQAALATGGGCLA